VLNIAHVLRVTLFLILQHVMLVHLELLLVLLDHHVLLPPCKEDLVLLILPPREQILNVPTESVQSHFELSQVGSKLIKVVLHILVHDAVIEVRSLLIPHFHDGHNFGFVIDIEDRVVHDVLEQLVGNRLYFLC
jgi:hypothetical protein